MSGFMQALPFVLEMEGGFVDHPADPGGATNCGVTQATYDRWRQSQGAPARTVREITPAEVQAIYHRDYWLAGKCDGLPWPVSLCHFDACVNHGVRAATKLLQRAAGVADDGVHGPRTQAAIEAAGLTTLYARWYAARLRLYYDICQGRPASRTFLLGWVRRMVHLHDVAGRAA